MELKDVTLENCVAVARFNDSSTVAKIAERFPSRAMEMIQGNDPYLALAVAMAVPEQAVLIAIDHNNAAVDIAVALPDQAEKISEIVRPDQAVAIALGLRPGEAVTIAIENPERATMVARLRPDMALEIARALPRYAVDIAVAVWQRAEDIATVFPDKAQAIVGGIHKKREVTTFEPILDIASALPDQAANFAVICSPLDCVKDIAVRVPDKAVEIAKARPDAALRIANAIPGQALEIAKAVPGQVDAIYRNANEEVSQEIEDYFRVS